MEKTRNILICYAFTGKNGANANGQAYVVSNSPITKTALEEWRKRIGEMITDAKDVQPITITFVMEMAEE